jgi:hypothetical protein
MLELPNGQRNQESDPFKGSDQELHRQTIQTHIVQKVVCNVENRNQSHDTVVKRQACSIDRYPGKYKSI